MPFVKFINNGHVKTNTGMNNLDMSSFYDLFLKHLKSCPQAHLIGLSYLMTGDSTNYNDVHGQEWFKFIPDDVTAFVAKSTIELMIEKKFVVDWSGNEVILSHDMRFNFSKFMKTFGSYCRNILPTDHYGIFLKKVVTFFEKINLFI